MLSLCESIALHCHSQHAQQVAYQAEGNIEDHDGQQERMLGYAFSFKEQSTIAQKVCNQILRGCDTCRCRLSADQKKDRGRLDPPSSEEGPYSTRHHHSLRKYDSGLSSPYAITAAVKTAARADPSIDAGILIKQTK